MAEHLHLLQSGVIDWAAHGARCALRSGTWTLQSFEIASRVLQDKAKKTRSIESECAKTCMRISGGSLSRLGGREDGSATIWD